MTFDRYKYLVMSDLYRITNKTGISSLIRNIIWGEAYQYVFWMRTCRFVYENRYFKFTLYPITRLLLRHYAYKYGVSIPFTLDVGSGFYVGHFGCIVVSGKSRIGKNCNISQGVTIGRSNRGRNMGYPSIGNNVYIGPGAKIIGSITIGNNVAIGANCVVTKDIPDNAVVVGVPGKIISLKGSHGYINKIDYEDKIK